jgi:hypothetical protein
MIALGALLASGVLFGRSGAGKEHIFTDWLRDCFHRDATTTHTFGQITWPLADPTLSEPHIRTKIGQGHSEAEHEIVVYRRPEGLHVQAGVGAAVNEWRH